MSRRNSRSTLYQQQENLFKRLDELKLELERKAERVAELEQLVSRAEGMLKSSAERLSLAELEISQRDDVIEKLRRRLKWPRVPEVASAQWSREVDHTDSA